MSTQPPPRKPQPNPRSALQQTKPIVRKINTRIISRSSRNKAGDMNLNNKGYSVRIMQSNNNGPPPLASLQIHNNNTNSNAKNENLNRNITAQNRNMSNNNSTRGHRARNTKLWTYLESRKGLYCLTTQDMTIDEEYIVQGTLGVVEQKGNQHPVIRFCKPFEWLTTTKLGKDQLSFSLVCIQSPSCVIPLYCTDTMHIVYNAQFMHSVSI